MDHSFYHVQSSAEKEFITFTDLPALILAEHPRYPNDFQMIAAGNFGEIIYQRIGLEIGCLDVVGFKLIDSVEILFSGSASSTHLVYCEKGNFQFSHLNQVTGIVAQTQFHVMSLTGNGSHSAIVPMRSHNEETIIYILSLFSGNEDANVIQRQKEIKYAFEYLFQTNKSLFFQSSADFTMLMTQIRKEFVKDSPDRMVVQAYLDIIFLEVLKLGQLQVNGDFQNVLYDPDQTVIYEIAQNIILEIDEPLNMKQLAFSSHLNKSKLKLLFKKYMGLPASDFKMSVRMQKAKQLILETELSIQEISLLVGYSNPSQFSTMFKRKMGYSPNQLRKS